MSCASTWDRLPDAATISLISVHTEKDIAMYKPVKNKEPVRVEESDDIQLGFSEMAALGKGLRGGLKSGIGAVKEVAGDRANAEMANAKHLSKYFMVELPSRVSSSIVSSGFENRQWADKTDEWINLVKLGKKTQRITSKANADVVVTFKGHLGVVKVSDQVKGLGGLVKLDLGSTTGGATYELIARYTMFFADATSYIGAKSFKVNSGIKKRTDKGVPEFSDDDFKKVAEELTKKVAAYLRETRLTG